MVRFYRPPGCRNCGLFEFAPAAGTHTERSSIMGKGNKVRKKEVKKPKQDKTAKTVKK